MMLNVTALATGNLGGGSGTQGPQGEQGPQGIQGPIGPRGSGGESTVIDLSNVSMSAVNINNASQTNSAKGLITQYIASQDISNGCLVVADISKNDNKVYAKPGSTLTRSSKNTYNYLGIAIHDSSKNHIVEVLNNGYCTARYNVNNLGSTFTQSTSLTVEISGNMSKSIEIPSSVHSTDISVNATDFLTSSSYSGNGFWGENNKMVTSSLTLYSSHGFTKFSMDNSCNTNTATNSDTSPPSFYDFGNAIFSLQYSDKGEEWFDVSMNGFITSSIFPPNSAFFQNPIKGSSSYAEPPFLDSSYNYNWIKAKDATSAKSMNSESIYGNIIPYSKRAFEAIKGKDYWNTSVNIKDKNAADITAKFLKFNVYTCWTPSLTSSIDNTSRSFKVKLTIANSTPTTTTDLFKEFTPLYTDNSAVSINSFSNLIGYSISDISYVNDVSFLRMYVI